MLPFQEYIPDWILDRIDVRTIEAGAESPIFQLDIGSGKPQRFRTLICYEAVLPGFVRSQSGGIDFFVNVTEDIWYGRTAHVPQHTSVLILRAVENRMPVVRCCNMGPSGVVGVTGRFDRSERIFEPEVMFKELRPGRMWSLHRAGGYRFPLAMLLIALSRFFIKLRARSRSAPER